MKRTMICALIASLALGAALSAMADPPGGDRRPGASTQPSGPRPGGPGRPGGPSGGGGRPTPGRPGPGPGGNRPTPSPPSHKPNPAPGHRPKPGHGHRPSPGHGHRANPGPGHRPNPGPGHRPNRGHGHRPPSRPTHRPIYGWNHHRYRAGPFRYPAGFGYRRWSVGQSLPSLLFSSAYYFTNYAVLGLDSPPYGYQWVRYGPDVMLVNIRTGEILDVINNAFY